MVRMHTLNTVIFFSIRFNPVVGGGSNAAVIHYSRNDQKVSFLKQKLFHLLP